MSQCDDILKHLRRGSITPLEALIKYNCICLAERIRDLRERGHQIITEMVKDKKKKYARYILIKEKK